MFKRLRIRLIFSHTLPIVILTPALGIVLYLLLETRHSLGDLADQLHGQGVLIIQIAQDDPTIWTDKSKAAAVLDGLKSTIDSRIMLLDNRAHLLASSLSTDQDRIGERIDFSVIKQALNGQTSWIIDYSPYMQTRILDMGIPVFNNSSMLIGIVRLSYDITEIEQRTLPIGGVITITFVAGAIAALSLGFWLAHSVNTPLAQLIQAVEQLRPGMESQSLPETGPDEVRLVAKTYNEMTRRLNALEKTRQQLIANVVHELGTPLGAIKAAAEALQDGAVSNQGLASELALGIDSQVNQMRLLLDDLALLGSSEIKPIALHVEWCNVEELIQAQCYTYAYWAKKKRIDLSYNIKSELPIVFADPNRLNQVLANLLHNAYKYSPRGSKIMVAAEAIAASGSVPASILIEVIDNGPGIPLDEQTRIFDLLYRSPHHRNMDKGLGIGLALSKRLVEAHGGTLTVTSSPGHGTTFQIRLPVGRPH